MKAVLDEVNLNKPNGLRDFVILSVMYSSGIRVSEVIGIKVKDTCKYCGAPLNRNLVTCEYCGQPYIDQIQDGISVISKSESDDILHILMRLLPPESPTKLNRQNAARIQRYFPVPTDFTILWADISDIDANPYGVVITDQALIVKNESSRFKNDYHAIPWILLDAENISIDSSGTLLINEEPITKCYSKSLMDTFHKYFLMASEEPDSQDFVSANGSQNSKYAYKTEFNGKYGAGNTKTGHGNYFEEVGTKLDVLSGEKSTFIGSDFAKDGADKRENCWLFLTKTLMIYSIVPLVGQSLFGNSIE